MSTQFVRIDKLAAEDTAFRIQIKSVDSLLRESSEATKPGEDDYMFAARLMVDSLIKRRLVAPLVSPDGKMHVWVKILGLYVPDGGTVDDECEALVATPAAHLVSTLGGRMELQ